MHIIRERKLQMQGPIASRECTSVIKCIYPVNKSLVEVELKAVLCSAGGILRPSVEACFPGLGGGSMKRAGLAVLLAWVGLGAVWAQNPPPAAQPQPAQK